MTTLILAGVHATAATFMILGIFLAWAGLPDWKPGETANSWDGANYWMITRGLAMACLAAPLVTSTRLT